MTSFSTGMLLEEFASQYLQQHNLVILQRNFRCKLGEIDIIAQDKDCLVFAEVRYRKNNFFGSAAESITTDKQKKLFRTANFYLQTKSWRQAASCRFDVIAISENIESPKIEWIKDAFNE